MQSYNVLYRGRAEDVMNIKLINKGRLAELLFITTFALLLTLNMTACGGHIKNGDVNSGIKGVATVGPVSPVSRPGEVNEKPYEDAVIVVMSLDNKEAARANADADGSFIIKLPPGKYEVAPSNTAGSMLPYAAPFQVDVAEGEYTEVTVSYDSGIR
jgi:hypothetical protein